MVDLSYVIGVRYLVKFMLLVFFVCGVDGIMVEVYFDLENVLLDGV